MIHERLNSHFGFLWPRMLGGVKWRQAIMKSKSDPYGRH